MYFILYTGTNISKNCATKYTLANLYDDAQQLLKGSLEEIANDPFNKIQGSKHGPEFISSAESLLQNHAIYDVAKFCKILDKLWKAVTSGDKSKVPSNQREKMWKAYHVLCTDPKFIEEVTAYLTVRSQTFFVQSLIRKLFEKIVQRKSVLPSSDTDLHHSQISPIEENILRYAAGFVPFSLKKHCMKRESHNIEYEEKIKCLNSIGVSNEIEHSQDFLEYTQSWLKKQNRGGLFMLNNDGYQFFKAVECHCRKYFQQKCVKGVSDIRLPVINAVFRDKVALEHWKKATVGRDSAVSDQVMRMCIKLWINIRGHAFAVNYIEKFKNLQTAQASKKKALRKDLKSMKLS